MQYTWPKEERQTTPTNRIWAQICATCRSAPSTVYCRADCAFLCTGCEARIHSANRVESLHERVRVCEACERAPAAFLCKADAASLCANCDSDIHSANPLALFGASEEQTDGFLNQDGEENYDDETTSWLLLNPVKSTKPPNLNILFGGESVDEYLDLDDYNPDQQNKLFGLEQYENDHHQQEQFSVPDQKNNPNDSIKPVQEQQNYHNIQLELDYEAPGTEYAYPTSYTHSVSVSSLDIGIVPESSLSDGSVSHTRQPKGTIDMFSNNPIEMPTQLNKMDREARVLRYREKKKNRKFEKTIRYASRKAYVEKRPRVKGRFAKRTNVDVEVVQMFSTTMVPGNGYGIVPSF
ncbi:hypothetical protein LIER_12817 [Lithospermum erythrorhizon]|uniref:Uncharacterized protein n=1 Tax=Lithospermum erythrorhizon TaxID=34254 RepID=A0AAV3PXB1_LITER